jgi:hypothetical protein
MQYQLVIQILAALDSDGDHNATIYDMIVHTLRSTGSTTSHIHLCCLGPYSSTDNFNLPNSTRSCASPLLNIFLNLLIVVTAGIVCSIGFGWMGILNRV